MSGQYRSLRLTIAWLFTEFTLVLLSVYWVHNAWYRHAMGSMALDIVILALWARAFWKDIRRWTGPRR